MKRILVVDDKEQNLYYLQVLFTAHGYVVETSRHGVEALAMARSTRPDMVISDLLMPVMDGYTLLRHWKVDPVLRHVPFIVYTATYTEPEDERLAMEMGADAFILKPAEPEDLVARIQEVAARGDPVVAQATDFAHGDEQLLMQGYSRTLIRKLEEKSLQLEEANRALQRDLVEHRRVEAALRASERELRALAEAMPQMVWMTRPDGANIYFNQRWVDYTGMSVEDSMGDRWVEPFHADDKPMAQLAWKRATEGLADYSVEARLRRADGIYRWMLIRGLPYRDDAGEIIKWMGTCTDIEDLKCNEEIARDNAQEQRRLAVELETERARLVAAQAVSKVGSWETDLATLDLIWSLETYRIFGATPGKFIPSHPRFLELVHPDDRAMVDKALQDSVTSASPGFIEHRIIALDGQRKVVEERWQVVGAGPGSAARAIGTCQDVTERQALQAQLRQAQRLESVGQLTGGVAHDFNNLLTVILGNAEILAERLADNRAMAELAGMVVDAAERGAQLSQRLLAFGRKQALEPRSVDVNALVAGMDALLRRTLGEHIEIAFVGAPQLWNALMDPAQLDNALLNLCLNARDAMPGGGRLTIETANADMSNGHVAQQTGVRPGQYVLLTVSDTGTGISPEHLGRVFEPFFTTKEVGKGTGLGLAMIYGFVKQSGGHVTIDSRRGSGTTVRMYLPRTMTESVHPPLPAQLQAQALTSARSQGTILLVEDDDMVRRYAHDQLTALGYQVIEADTGMQAFEVLKGQGVIDLLFTDVVMPGMSGRALVEQATELRPGLKVLYASGYTEDAIVHQGQLDAGVLLLSKPYRREELASKVMEAMAR